MRGNHKGSLSYSSGVALAAGFTPAATMLPGHPVVASSDNLEKSEPYTGRRAGPSRSDRPMRGNHKGSLSYSSSVALAAGVTPAANMLPGHPVVGSSRG